MPLIHGCAFNLTFDRRYSVNEVKDYFGHTTTNMIERVYAPLRAEEKRQKVSEVIYDLISDSSILAHSNASDVSDEISSIRKAIISGKSVYEYRDRELLMKALSKNPTLMANIRFVENKL